MLDHVADETRSRLQSEVHYFILASLFVFRISGKKYLSVQYLCVWLVISAWWRAQRLRTKWLTVALAAGLDSPWGENILALHKFLTRFQIAGVSILFSAPAALNETLQWPFHVHMHDTRCYKLQILILNY